jgi:hypothetical protein
MAHGGLIPINQPVPIEVKEGNHHTPQAIQLKGQWVRVGMIADLWEIDEEWWREKPIGRRYYRVVTEDERIVTIFWDLVDGGWYRQNA